MTAFVTAPAGFLLAVLWFDLMFDVQVIGHGRRSGELPSDVLASIAAYYARVTTRARPMNRLIAEDAARRGERRPEAGERCRLLH